MVPAGFPLQFFWLLDIESLQTSQGSFCVALLLYDCVLEQREYGKQ